MYHNFQCLTKKKHIFNINYNLVEVLCGQVNKDRLILYTVVTLTLQCRKKKKLDKKNKKNNWKQLPLTFQFA